VLLGVAASAFAFFSEVLLRPMWDEETKTYWMPVRQALYGVGDDDGLFPDVRLRDVPTVFPTRKTLISGRGYRVVFVPESDVIALRKRLKSTR
jgi:hypothetical protein